MGHLINPITYRLGKTKFWNFTWANKTKKNYKNFLLEDLNSYKFYKWLISVLSWHKIGVFIHDFKVIKNDTLISTRNYLKNDAWTYKDGDYSTTVKDDEFK